MLLIKKVNALLMQISWNFNTYLHCDSYFILLSYQLNLKDTLSSGKSLSKEIPGLQHNLPRTRCLLLLAIDNLAVELVGLHPQITLNLGQMWRISKNIICQPRKFQSNSMLPAVALFSSLGAFNGHELLELPAEMWPQGPLKYPCTRFWSYWSYLFNRDPKMLLMRYGS